MNTTPASRLPRRTSLPGAAILLAALLAGPALPSRGVAAEAGIGRDNTIAGRKGKARTIAELAAMYDSAPCVDCHYEIGDEWERSAHSEPILGKRRPGRKAQAILTIFDVAREEWPFTRLSDVSDVKVEHLMGCARCHLPQLEDAEDGVARELVGDFLRWRDARRAGDRKGAEVVEKKLSALSVNCLVCHNRNAILHRWSDGFPRARTIYGAAEGGGAHLCGKFPYRGRSAILSEAVFCGQCHGQGPLLDRDNPTQCSTAYGSYLYDYKPRGGDESCQDCHMRRNGFGHYMASYRDRKMVDAAIDFDLEVSPIPGGAEPSGNGTAGSAPPPLLLARVGMTNRAGHSIPDGCPTVTRLLLEVAVRSADGNEIYFDEKFYMPIPQDYARGDKMGRGPFEKATMIIDTSLPPLRKVTERYEIRIPAEALPPAGSDAAEFTVSARLLYLPFGSTKEGDDPVVWRDVTRKVRIAEVD